jgi:hypothetical protein
MYARDDTPLPPILTDGVWTVPFEFFGASTATPLDQTGTTWSLVFAPKGRSQPAAADVHEMTTAVNGGITVSGNTVTVSNATWTGWAPGVYQVELRQTNLASPEPIYVGTVTVARGLSDLPSLGGGSVLPSTAGAAVQLFNGPTAVQIVRGEAAGAALAAEQSAAAAAASATDAAGSATSAASDAAAAHADRLQADADVASASAAATQTAADRVQTGADRTQTGQDAAATAADRTAVHADKLAADTDATDAAGSATAAAGSATAASGSATLAQQWASQTGSQVAATDYSAKEWSIGTTLRGVAGGGSAKDWASYMGGTVDDTSKSAKAYASDASGSATTATTQAGIAATQATNAAASATAAASSAASANVNDTAGAALILERAATQDPSATLAQAAATVQRGVENRPAASSGAAYFRRGLLASSNLTAVASFTRATTATATDQSGNVSSVASGAPRVTTAGYLSEEARTNLALQSQAFDNAAWTKSGVTVTANATTAPDGTATGDLLTAIAGNSAHNVTQAGNVLASATNVSVAFDFKKGTHGFAFIDLVASGNNYAAAVFDVGAGALGETSVGSGSGAVVSRTIEPSPVGSGWYRCTLVANVTGANPTIIAGLAGAASGNIFNSSGQPIWTAAGTETLSLWQADEQAGGFPTSRIPTTTATVTRNPDVATETVNIAVGQAFTVTGKFILPLAPANSYRVFQLAAAANTNDLLELYTTGSALGVASTTNSQFAQLQASWASLGIAGGQPVGFAISVNGDAVTFSFNGQAAQSFTSAGGALAQALTRLGLGCRLQGDLQLNSTLRELNVLMRAMSAAEVQTASDVSLERSYDFTTQTYKYLGQQYGTIAELPGTTFSRATTANVLTSAGFLLAVASGALRVSDAGLTVEPTRTNLFLNSTAPATQTITLSATGNYAISVLGSGSATVAAGTATITGAGAATAAAPLIINCTATGTITVTVAGGPTRVQVEAGGSTTTPIDTAGAPVQRNADVLTSAEANPASFSVQCEVTIPASTRSAAAAWRWDNATNTDIVALIYDRASGHLFLQVYVGNVQQANLDLGAVAAGSTYKIAAAVALNDVAASVNGAACVTKSASVALPSLANFWIGTANGTGLEWGPGIRKLKRWRGRRTNAQLQADAT